MEKFTLALAQGLEKGSKFLLSNQEEASFLQLAEVKPMGGNAQFEQFSLFFKGALERCLPQDVYKLQHDTLDEVLWMLVPVGRTEDGFLYEAVFSVLKDETLV
ncbi:DUF6916 family protein [Paenibacillus sp. y28]|uniref:DUF6916 family protein n=1 Tax=Paenibacillus sp. y28 TaxID=3129110 RepID=UPI003017AA7F